MKKYFNPLKEKAFRHKIIIQNFSYLSALQICNLLIPLIIYPYLIRVLGIETYGLVVFAQATVAYLTILVEFGFNVSATREISVNRSNNNKISEIVSSVIIIKFGIFIISLIILIFLLSFIPKAHGYKILFILSMWSCLYDVIFPVWYFQGIEQMKYITYITLISRIIFLVLIFALIHKSSDFLLVPIINGIGALISGLVALIIIFKKHRIIFKWQNKIKLKYYLVNSIPLFMSNISIQIYIATNKILAGAFLGLANLAYYDLGEKILTLFKIPISILSQVLFPKMSKSYDLNFLKKTLGILFSIVLVSIIIFQFVADKFVILYAGVSMLPAANVSRILLVSLIPLIISNGLGIQTLLAQGYNRHFSNILMKTALFYFVIAGTLIVTKAMTIYTLSAISIIIELFMLYSFYNKCKMIKLI